MVSRYNSKNQEKEQAQSGSITVEMSLLFPSLFLLWILILWNLFGLYARCLTETAVDRMVFLIQTDPLQGEQRGIQEVQRIAGKSGLGIKIDSCELYRDRTLFYTGYRAELQLSHDLWGVRRLHAERSIFSVQGAEVRNALDLIWAIGEELPGTGNVIREYKMKIARLRDEIGS